MCVHTNLNGLALFLANGMFVAPFTQENPDLFKWLTGQTVPPEEVSANSAFTVGQWEPEGAFPLESSLWWAQDDGSSL